MSLSTTNMGRLPHRAFIPAYPWGWPEAEDYCTWAEARSVLWGGLIVEFPDTRSRRHLRSNEHTFLRSLVAARTDFARDFLAYGRMQRPPIAGCAKPSTSTMDWRRGWLRKARSAGIEAAIGSSLSSAEKRGPP